MKEKSKALDEMLAWVVQFKNDHKKLKAAALANPLPFIKPEFHEQVRERRIINSMANKKALNPHVFEIPDNIYHLDPPFWQEQLKNKKEFKRKYPYFYVGK